MFITPQVLQMCQHARSMEHKTRSISFTLVVNNFGVKYVRKEHVNHLIWCIKQKYELTKDWMGNLYCGTKLIWIIMPIPLTSPCWDISKSCYCNISIACRQSCSIAHTLLPQNNTEPKHEHHSPLISCQNSPLTRSRKSNTSLVAYCIMPEQSTSQFSWH
jgi:hypothetical protein